MFLIFVERKIVNMERFSMKEVLKSKFGEEEKNIKTKRSTKRSNDKVKNSSSGKKYETKIVDGVKYMVLK